MARNQQIRDRVAFGDDLFRLEQQEDGRTRLVPAPNQVQTQGTDVNAELMQPWEDMHTAATRNGVIRLGRDGTGMPELTIPQLDSLSSAVVSSTPMATAAKTVALPGFVRRTGSTVWVRFTAGNSAVNPTLNINSTGAAPIQLNGAAITDANVARRIAANVLYGFVFDGTAWQMVITGANLPTMGQGVGTVATAGATVAKVGILPGFARHPGALVWLRFSSQNTAARPTLNVESSGTAPIEFHGGDLPTGAIRADGIHGFVFDGTNWQLVNPARHNHNAADITDGRLSAARLPTSGTADRVLGVVTANADPAFVQVNHGMMATDSVGTAQVRDLNVTNAKIADRTIRQAKMHVVEGLVELGLPTATATLHDVINAIRALPISQPASVRISLFAGHGTGLFTRLRTPLLHQDGMMQIERIMNNSNWLQLTYIVGQNTNALRVFTAIHGNAVATEASADAIVWREMLIGSNGRMLATQLPISPVADRVLAVGAANSGAIFRQINNAMMENNSVGTAQIQNLSVTTAKLDDYSVTNAKIANNTIRQAKMQVFEGLLELGLPSASATLLDVINAIRALPQSRPISVRISLSGTNRAGLITRLRAPVSNADGMMQIERVMNNSNWLQLTYIIGAHTEGLRVFTAIHGNFAPTEANVEAITWREVLITTNGRVLTTQLPTSTVANRVLAAVAANSGADFRQINNAMMENNSVGTAQIQNLSVTTAKLDDYGVTNAKIANNTIRQAKMFVREGLAELGLPTASATLLDVINAIRALPISQPVSVRINLSGTNRAGLITRLRAPQIPQDGIMQIERIMNNSNWLQLTCITGHNTDALRIFTAIHANAVATEASTDAIVWREILLGTNGRILATQLPISTVADRVLAVGAANSGAVFRQINNAMLENNSVSTAQIQDLNVTTAKIADNAITAAKINNIAALGRSIAIGAGASVSTIDTNSNIAIGGTANATSGTNNIAIGANASVTGINNHGSIAIGRESSVSHMNAAVITPNSGAIIHASGANNRVTLGSTTTTVGGWSAWNTLSDSRDKCDIAPLAYDPLAFVNALRPKQYRTDFRSGYRCFREISDVVYDALSEYDKRHHIREASVFTIDGTPIEWIDDTCVLTNNGRVKDMGSVPDFLEGTVTGDRYATSYLCMYAKNKGIATQKFVDDKCLDLPDIAEAWKLYCKCHGADASSFAKTADYAEMHEGSFIEAFIESRIKVSRKARFLVVELTPDGTYAGKRHHWGFMAQEVEQAAKEMGIDCPAVQYMAHNVDSDGIPEGDDLYTMGYTELIAPLVGAVQQLADTVQRLQGEIAEYRK